MPGSLVERFLSLCTIPAPTRNERKMADRVRSDLEVLSLPVREDGTISLPLVPSIQVSGLSLAEAQAVLERAYTVDHGYEKPGVGGVMDFGRHSGAFPSNQ